MNIIDKFILYAETAIDYCIDLFCEKLDAVIDLFEFILQKIIIVFNNVFDLAPLLWRHRIKKGIIICFKNDDDLNRFLENENTTDTQKSLKGHFTYIEESIFFWIYRDEVRFVGPLSDPAEYYDISHAISYDEWLLLKTLGDKS